LPELQAETSSNEVQIVELRLNDYLHTVVQHNENLQAQMLETQVSNHKKQAERGAFEPDFDTSVTREANRRTNNVQQIVADNTSFFNERNTVYDSGIESLLPSGGKVRLGYTLSDLVNNINPTGLNLGTNSLYTRQYQTFVGATFTQPLLRNGGFTPTLAALRVAAMDSEIAFQQYRRQLMLTVSRAESAYWNLYFAQEQLRFFDDSVSVAQNILDDSHQKLKAGQASELDVMEAQSGLALRETKRNEAQQGYFDALGSLETLTGKSLPANFSDSSQPQVRVVDVPPQTNALVNYAHGLQAALDLNPDYLIQKQKYQQEELRVNVARNQLLPELDFKTAYGYNGLGSTPGNSWELAQSQQFPSWSAGLELIVPLGGNIKGRNLYGAAKLSTQEAYLALHGMQTEIGNEINFSIQKSRAWQQSIQSYETVVHYNEALLDTQTKRLSAGTIDGHKVLEVEADLLDARQNLANALVQYRHSLLEVEIASGEILRHRQLEVTQQDLKRQTTAYLQRVESPRE
jgi:outer membrane protein TolC